MSQQPTNLKEKTTVELKALAYDVSEALQQYSNLLNTINGEINLRKSQEKDKSPRLAQPEIPYQ